MEEQTRRHARALGAYMAARMNGQTAAEELKRLKDIETEIENSNK